MNELNCFCLILSGPATTSDQLLKDVKKYYEEQHIKNIIISSYSKFINNKIKKYALTLSNDIYGKKIIDAPIKRIKNSVKFGYNDNDIIKGISINSSIFFQVLTTRRGINMAKYYFKSCKYYMKLRADMFIPNLSKFVREWINQLNDDMVRGNFFDKKLYVRSYIDTKRRPWHICDYWIFGTASDIEKYYSFKKSVLNLKTDGKIRIKRGNRWIIERLNNESMISSGYLLEKEPNFDFYTTQKLYFNYIKGLNAIWWKHNINKRYSKFLDLNIFFIINEDLISPTVQIFEKIGSKLAHFFNLNIIIRCSLKKLNELKNLKKLKYFKSYSYDTSNDKQFQEYCIDMTRSKNCNILIINYSNKNRLLIDSLRRYTNKLILFLENDIKEQSNCDILFNPNCYKVSTHDNAKKYLAGNKYKIIIDNTFLSSFQNDLFYHIFLYFNNNFSFEFIKSIILDIFIEYEKIKLFIKTDNKRVKLFISNIKIKFNYVYLVENVQKVDHVDLFIGCKNLLCLSYIFFCRPAIIFSGDGEKHKSIMNKSRKFGFYYCDNYKKYKKKEFFKGIKKFMNEEITKRISINLAKNYNAYSSKNIVELIKNIF